MRVTDDTVESCMHSLSHAAMLGWDRQMLLQESGPIQDVVLRSIRTHSLRVGSCVLEQPTIPSALNKSITVTQHSMSRV